MKKYVRFTCTVCHRVADRLVDNVRFQTDKCNITLACEGRLVPIEYRSNANITPTLLTGVSDWRPRGTTVLGEPSSTDVELINTSSGTTKQVVFAVRGTAVPQLTLKLNERADTPRAFRQYIFRREGPFQSIFGVESGLEKKTLRYSTTDTVQVLLNGIQVSNYVLNDGTSSPPAPLNTILFDAEINLPGIVQIDVIVFPTVVTTTTDITLYKNIDEDSRRDTGSWENVESIQMNGGSGWQTYNLYYFDLADATALKTNTVLTVQSLNIGASTIPLSDVRILLARSPYTSLDRYTTLAVDVNSLSFETDYLKFHVVDKQSRLDVTKASINAVFPPIRATKFQVEGTIRTAVPGDADQITIDEPVIVGPDV